MVLYTLFSPMHIDEKIPIMILHHKAYGMLKVTNMMLSCVFIRRLLNC